MEVKLTENFLPRNLLKESDCCRVCALGSTGSQDLNVLFIPIYEESDLLKNKKLNVLINEYLPLKVHQTDLDFPRKICSTCHYSLEKTIQFFDKISAAQEILRKIVYRNENIESRDRVEAHCSYSEGNSILSNGEPQPSVCGRPQNGLNETNGEKTLLDDNLLPTSITEKSEDDNYSNIEPNSSIHLLSGRRGPGRPRKFPHKITNARGSLLTTSQRQRSNPRTGTDLSGNSPEASIAEKTDSYSEDNSFLQKPKLRGRWPRKLDTNDVPPHPADTLRLGPSTSGAQILTPVVDADSSSCSLDAQIFKNSDGVNCSNSEVEVDSSILLSRRDRGRPRKASYTVRCKSADASQLQPMTSSQPPKRRGRPPRMKSNDTMKVKPSSVDSLISMSLHSVTSVSIPDYPDVHNLAAAYNTELTIPSPSNRRITRFSQDVNYSNSAGNSPYASPKRRNSTKIVDEPSPAGSRSPSLTLTPVFVKLVDICARMRAAEGTDIIMIPPNVFKTEPDAETTETLECADSQNETGFELEGRDGLMEVDKLDIDITMDGGVDLDSVEFPSAFQESEIRIIHVEGFPQVDASAETQTQADQPLVADNSYSPGRLLSQPLHLRRRGQPGNYLEEPTRSAKTPSDPANSQVLNIAEGLHYQTSESTDEILPIVSILNAQTDDGGSRTTNIHKVNEVVTTSLVDNPTPRKRGRPAKSIKGPSAADISSTSPGRKRRKIFSYSSSDRNSNSQSPEWCGNGSGIPMKGVGKISARGHGESCSSTKKIILKDSKSKRTPKKGLLKASVVKTYKASPSISISPASLDKEHVSESTSTGDVVPTVEKERKKTRLSKVLAKNQVIKCPDCNKQFKYNTSFRKHRETVHEVKLHTDTGLTCLTCGKAFNSRQILEEHQLTHSISNVREFKCETCGTEFKSKGGLRNHTKSFHSEEVVKPYSCEYCEETFKLKGKMMLHRLIHTGGEPHKCPVLNCNRIYLSAMALRNHTSIHHGGKGGAGAKPVLSSTRAKQFRSDNSSKVKVKGRIGGRLLSKSSRYPKGVKLKRLVIKFPPASPSKQRKLSEDELEA